MATIPSGGSGVVVALDAATGDTEADEGAEGVLADGWALAGILSATTVLVVAGVGRASPRWPQDARLASTTAPDKTTTRAISRSIRVALVAGQPKPHRRRCVRNLRKDVYKVRPSRHPWMDGPVSRAVRLRGCMLVTSEIARDGGHERLDERQHLDTAAPAHVARPCHLRLEQPERGHGDGP